MQRRILRRIRDKIRSEEYYFTEHAKAELAKDDFLVVDVEQGALRGKIAKVEPDLESGRKYTIVGESTDRRAIGIVCKFTASGQLRIITVYEVTEEG